ncbi:shikimate dehydrogenase family protein [Marinomonas sp. IMCC 4694]|uniref:shikimate dehydrogenase family protein n=1 Tax=Marinomonas sp. IMCC 4694 TaxID=2605432 RepID=UPI0011E6E82E|nr:shikimate dehydrogenase [Marinomonas sp. IMCC 4694]TYL48839.1 shikimate dehydrogenase [Marinomonas sp. IMCC 4694]
MTVITGDTRLFPILGDPIAQVRSPEFLTRILQRRQENGIVTPMHVAPEHFTQVMESLRYTQNVHGIVITIPHKIPALAACDSTSERAQFIGSVNIIRKQNDGLLYGDNVDGIGYLDGVKKEGFEVSNTRALLIGAGGAGSAVAFEILQRGAAYLAIFDLDQQRLHSLIERLNMRFPNRAGVGNQDPTGFDFIANVTPVGMRPNDPYPVDIHKLHSGQFVADAITKPEVSPMIEHARSLGCCTMVGAGMFNAEAEILVEFMLKDPEKNT